MVVRRRVDDDEDEEPEQAPSRNGKIIVARTIKRGEVPNRRAPGARNPEYEKLVRRLIRWADVDKAAVIPVASKAEKVKIREGVRKPLRVRGYDLTAVTDFDDELGEILILYGTKRELEEPEDEDIETEDDEQEEEPVVRRKKVRRG